MEEFQKIDLSSSVNSPASEDSLKSKPTENMKRRSIKLPKKTLLVLLAIVLLLGFGSMFTIVLPAQQTYSSAQKTYTQAKKAWDAMKKQNIELTSTELAATKKSLTQTQNNFKSLSFLRFVPLANNYYNDADHLLKAGQYGLDAGTIVVESIKPYADVLGLKGQGSFVMGSAEDRIKLAILTMGKITPRIDEVSQKLTLARKEIDQVDPNHYPEFLGMGKIRSQLISLRSSADKGASFVEEARPLIKVLPSLLGESKEKKYLILFQNDKELRPTGGFITAYAVFRVEKGVIHVDTSADIYGLDDTIKNKPKAPEPILKYLPKATTLNLRDSNLSPDYIESMKTFRSMYETSPAKKEVDGIIALDTHVLVSVIKILDDEVTADGITFTTKEDKRCHCPQVIYQLEDNISRPVNYIKAERKQLLGSLLYAIMNKALKSSPKLYWGPLFQSGITEINEKHILMYLYNHDAQAGVAALNAAGRIVPFDGDYLHINETNFSGAKTNLFVEESVEQNYAIDSAGNITKTLVIDYKNPDPPSDCNLERGGLCLNSVHRDWIRIYVPKGATLVDSTGSEVKMTTYEDLGKTVFEGFLTVRPLGTAKLTVKYKLPFKLAKGSSLPLLIQKQPGTDLYEYVIKVNGKTKEKFQLLTDKEFKLSI